MQWAQKAAHLQQQARDDEEAAGGAGGGATRLGTAAVDGEHAEPATLAATLSDNIKQNIGISAAIEVTPIGAIDRSAGKAVRIIDRRGE